jgi:SAM-dependent methyltransferase
MVLRLTTEPSCLHKMKPESFLIRIAKRILRWLRLEFTRLPERRLPVSQRLRYALRGLGYDVRSVPSQTSLRAPVDSEKGLLIKHYLENGRVPHSPGYEAFRDDFLRKVLSNKKLIDVFSSDAALPPGYGFGLDERCVEYPWFLSRASVMAKRYCDAGSAMNYDYILRHPLWKNKKLTIVTLVPERNCFFQHGISYVFEDLRLLPFADSWFDEIVCLSTLEHVGMDVSVFSKHPVPTEHNICDFEVALVEISRVLRRSGRLLFTVPFGRYQDAGWLQQFDSATLERAAEVFKPVRREDTFYRYSASGWEIAARKDCADCQYSFHSDDPNVFPPPDLAANARAVACCVWVKG